MVVQVSLDPPHIMGRKWPPKHAGWSQVSGIGCATFPSAPSPPEAATEWGSPRCDRTLPGGLSPRIVCPALQRAHSTHSAGTDAQLGGSPRGVRRVFLFAEWVQVTVAEYAVCIRIRSPQRVSRRSVENLSV